MDEPVTFTTFTKLYLTSVSASHVPGVFRGAWNDTAGAVTRNLSSDKTNGGLESFTARAESSSDNQFDVLLYRGISGRLAAQTISGTIDIVTEIAESAADADMYWHVHIYVTKGDADAPRGTLVADYTEFTTNEWPTVATCKGFQSPITLSPVDVLAGDYIVVEIGYIARNSLTSSRTGQIAYGTLDARGFPNADCVIGSTTGVGAGFLVFSSTLVGIAEDTHVSQLPVEIASTGDGAARVSQLPVEVVSQEAAARTRLSQLAVEVVSQTPPIRISQLGVEVVTASGISPELVSQLAVEIVYHNVPLPPENAILTIGLTWMILTDRTGAKYVWSDRPLPDPDTYYLGWKEFRVVQWGKIKRALSQVLTGQYENAVFTVSLDDSDRTLRELDKEFKIIGSSVEVYMISDKDRRMMLPATTVFRGTVTDGVPNGVLLYDLTVKDPYAEQISTQNPAPMRLFNGTDHPMCGKDMVACSAAGYVVSGAVAAGADTVAVGAGYGIFVPGAEITFSGHVTNYRVSSSDLTDPETTVTFTPDLTSPVADGETITVKETFNVTTAAGKRVPVPYGYIGDQQVIDGEDNGDGQGPVVYVGDRELSDGKVWAEFVWSAAACYSPDGKPFQQLYFWNNPLEFAGTVHYGSTAIHIGDLATEADSGRVAIPGYGNWTSLGFTDSFVDINSHRYTRLFLRGILRDWALGILRAPDNLGGVPFDVSAWGCEDVGDSTGALIADLFPQYLHALQNWMPPRGNCYQSGSWLPTPLYPDGTPMIDEASFSRAHTQSAVYVTGGFQGNFILGVNDDKVSARDLVARFNLSCGAQSGFNNKIQFMVNLVNTNIDTTLLSPAIGWERDIFSGTFRISASSRDLYTSILFQHTQDYFNRARSGWRSEEIGDGTSTLTDDGSVLIYNIIRTYNTIQLYMVRAKNRDTDSVYYDRGTQTAAVVLNLLLTRISSIQHLPEFSIGPAGFSYNLGDVVPLTHYEGLSSTGWTDWPIRVERIEIDPQLYISNMEGYDLEPLLELG